MVLEKEVIDMLSSLLNLKNGYGHIVSGGSEANILAVLAARKYKRVNGTPEIIVSTARHISIDKAADLTGIKLVKVPLNSNFEMRIELVDDLINERTIG